MLSSIQEILKYCFTQIWFNDCAIIRMSSAWPCCVYLAHAAVWGDLLILKSADAHLLSGGIETEECAVWGAFGLGLEMCVSICLRVKV